MRVNIAMNQFLDEAQQQRRCAVMPTRAVRQALLRRVRTGEIVSPMRGLYARASYWKSLDTVERNRHVVRAKSRQHPEWVFGGLEAVCMHGLDHDYALHSSNLTVISPTHAQAKPVHGITHICMPNCKYAVIDGVKVLPLVQTVAMGVRSFDFVNGMQITNCALRHGLTKQEIGGCMSRLGNCGASAWRVLEYGSDRCENGGESRAYGVMLDEGVAPPLLQHDIADAQTGRHARPDFYWVRDDRFVIVGELDGNEKYVNIQMTGGASVEQVVDAERERERLLLRNGVDRIVRFRVRETYDRARFIRKLLEAGVPLCK